MVRSIIGFLAAVAATAGLAAADHTRARAVLWADLQPAVQKRLSAAGVDDELSFAAFREAHERRTRERVREGDLDALVYYTLQSNAFTGEPPIEPAIAAKAFTDRLDAESRRRFLSADAVPADRVPDPVRRRFRALVPALRNPPPGSRLAFFRDLVDREAAAAPRLDVFLLEQYVRAMRFLYEKEFAASDRPAGAEAVAALYRERGLSTDTAVEAGYLVHLGLATLQRLDQARRIRRVLVVGPGLDLAPRTGLLEVGPPETYQPFAVIDSLVALGLARADNLAVTCVDVNPWVVEHLNHLRDRGVSLTLVSGIGDTEQVTMQEEYRSYFTGLGAATGDVRPVTTLPDRYRGRLRKSVIIRPAVLRVVDAVNLDIVTRRLQGDAFDLVVATNVFAYLDDVSLSLALANIAAMVGPGAVLLHNEDRGIVRDVTAEIGLPLQHARRAVIATVRGAATPLYDGIFLHIATDQPSRGR